MPKTPARGRRGAATGPNAGPLPSPCVVPISALVRDERLQVREGLDRGTVKTYENVLAAGGELPPVRVVDVAGTLYVVDGWHRIAAAERRQAHTVATVVTPGTLEDARWLAASANLAHGLPLTRAERRGVFNVYVDLRRHRDGRRYKSYREIEAELAGVGRHTTLRNWMRGDHPKVAAAMSKEHPEDEPPTNAGASWPATDPYAYAVEGARAEWASVQGRLAGLPAQERAAVIALIRRDLDNATFADADGVEAAAGVDF